MAEQQTTPEALIAVFKDPSVRAFLSDPNNIRALQEAATKLGPEGLDDDIRERFDAEPRAERQAVYLLLQANRWLSRLVKK